MREIAPVPSDSYVGVSFYMLRVRPVSIATALLILSALNGAFYIVGNPLRLTFVANVLVPFLAVGLLIGTLALTVCVLYARSFRLKLLEVVILAYLLILLGAADWGGVGIWPILLDFAKPVLFIAVVILMRNGLPPADRLTVTVNAIGWASVLLSIVLLALFWGMRLVGMSIYPAYMTLDAALGSGFLWTQGFAFPAYVLAAFFSGKRGLYIGMFFLLLLWGLRRWDRSIGIVAALGVAMALAIALAAEDGSLASSPGALASFVFKSSSRDIWNDSMLRFVLGGRMEEFEGAFAGPYSAVELLVGRGLGFSYLFESADGEISGYRNLHFTPASLVLYYGLAFLILLAAYLAPITYRAIRIMLRSNDTVALTYAGYFLVCLVYSLTEYSIFAYSNFAVATGVLMSLRRHRSPNREGDGGYYTSKKV